MSGNSVLVIKDLTSILGGKVVLDGLSLELKAGEILALAGPSGSGKKSVVRTLLFRLEQDLRTSFPYPIGRMALHIAQGAPIGCRTMSNLEARGLSNEPCLRKVLRSPVPLPRSKVGHHRSRWLRSNLPRCSCRARLSNRAAQK